MAADQGAEIVRVRPDSLAEEVGLEAGDRLVKVNGQPLTDLIDYQYMCADEELTLEVVKADGEEWLVEIDKDCDEELGLEFATATFDGLRHCRNKCVFCFVDQLPPNRRATLYDKDDDYRLSFMQGNFVTLTNVGDEDIERIIRMRLSPLYISVHATDPAVRVKMMANPQAGRIKQQLRRLADAGIEMHTQIVLCPGLNDGEVLQQTVADLAGFWPAVRSVAIVPVGLTKFREGLAPVRSLDKEGARRLVATVGDWQSDFRQRWERAFVCLSDEIYLLAGLDFPPAEDYDDFPQTENGVGLARIFLDDFADLEADLPKRVEPGRKVIVLTGVLGGQVLEPAIRRLQKIAGLELTIVSVINRFFGPSVTVTGLVTGSDLLAVFADNPPDQDTVIIIPEVMLRRGETVFLDDMTVDELAARLNRPVQVAENSARGLVETVLGR